MGTPYRVLRIFLFWFSAWPFDIHTIPFCISKIRARDKRHGLMPGQVQWVQKYRGLVTGVWKKLLQISYFGLYVVNTVQFCLSDAYSGKFILKSNISENKKKNFLSHCKDNSNKIRRNVLMKNPEFENLGRLSL